MYSERASVFQEKIFTNSVQRLLVRNNNLEFLGAP